MTFGKNFPMELIAHSTYVDKYDLPGAGVKQDGKISMLECAKIQFYVEPWLFHPTQVEQNYCRWTLQATQHRIPFHIPGPPFNDYYTIHKEGRRSGMYFMYTKVHAVIEARHQTEMRPHEFDTTAPDGSGFLFKGSVVYVSFFYLENVTITDNGYYPSYCFRCLVRRVWVDPAYYIQSSLQEDQAYEEL